MEYSRGKAFQDNISSSPRYFFYLINQFYILFIKWQIKLGEGFSLF